MVIGGNPNGQNGQQRGPPRIRIIMRNQPNANIVTEVPIANKKPLFAPKDSKIPKVSEKKTAPVVESHRVEAPVKLANHVSAAVE